MNYFSTSEVVATIFPLLKNLPRAMAKEFMTGDLNVQGSLHLLFEDFLIAVYQKSHLKEYHYHG